MAQEAEIPGAVVGGTYRLVSSLGGESGQVYEARHDRLSGRFVVKLIADADLDAFYRNARLVSALRHPGTVQVLDYGDAEGQVFVVMEHIDGKPLSELIAEMGLMPADRVARLVDHVAAGLAAAHEMGIVHGHLAPQRIFVQRAGSRNETTKVIGLGLGGDISAVPDLTELTPYTAPEQVGEEIGPASDQFALAAIAYEMLTGVPPFDDSTEREEPPSIRDYAPEVNVIVDDVIRRALAPEPDQRWRDIATFAQRLREAGDSATLEEKTRVTGYPLRPALASTSFTPTPVDGVEGFEPPTLETPLPDATPVSSVEVDLGTPLPQALAGVLVSRTTSSRPVHLPPPGGSTGFVLPPPVLPSPSQRSIPVPRHPTPPVLAAPEPEPWSLAPAPSFTFSGDGGATMMAATARRGSRRRGAGGLLVLGVAAAIVAFAVVKTDLLGRITGGAGRAAESAAAAHPAAPPVQAAAPAVAAEPQIATQAASATVEAPPPPAPAPAAAPPAAAPPAAEAIGNAPAKPHVVELPPNAGPTPDEMPAAAEQPVRHKAAPKRHRPTPAPLPPDLAAEEALLLGPPVGKPEKKAAAPKRAKRPAAAPAANAADPWAE